MVASPRLYRIAQRATLRDGTLKLLAPFGYLPGKFFLGCNRDECSGSLTVMFVYRRKREIAMTDRNSVVAIYDTHDQAEQAVKS